MYAAIVGIMASGKRTVKDAPTSFPNAQYRDLYVQPYLIGLIPLLLIMLVVFL